MKKLILLLLLIPSLVFAGPLNQGPISGSAGGGTGIGDMTKIVYDMDNDGVVDSAANATTFGGHAVSYFQVNLNLVAGTMNNGYICTYTLAGTLISCTTNPASFQPANANLTTYGSIAPSANVQSFLGTADYAAMRSALGLVIGTDIPGISGIPTTEFLAAWYLDGSTWKLKAAGAKVEYLTKTIYLPVAYAEDGAAPPGASSVLASTRKVKVRDFDGAYNENIEISFVAPMDFKAAGTIKFRFIGYVTNATAPADTEVVAFSLAGCSNGDSDALGCTTGDPQTSSLTVSGSGYAQYDRLAGAWSNAITITGLAADETVQVILIRLAESTDTYAQDFGLAGIEIKYIADIKTEASY
jgi:hypothetical protein